MMILKLISRLMEYPTAELQQHATQLAEVIGNAREISPAMRTALKKLLDDIAGQDLMDAQVAYGLLFDRGRALSLLLFEHVHGESRDRGQAMVDLMAQYEQHGFFINVRELPDHIPLYLEYLAERPDLEARTGLAEVNHILAMLSARLQERESPYHALFDALLMIAGVEVDIDALREKASSEERDDTPEAIDKIWEEEAVTFGVGDAHDKDACPSQTPSRPGLEREEQPTPMHWVHSDSKATLKTADGQR